MKLRIVVALQISTDATGHWKVFEIRTMEYHGFTKEEAREHVRRALPQVPFEIRSVQDGNGQEV